MTIPRLDSAILLDPDTVNKRRHGMRPLSRCLRDGKEGRTGHVLAPRRFGMTIAAQEAGCPGEVLTPLTIPGFHNAALHPIDLLIDSAGAAGTIAA
jgi:hypothetical protein